jgi:hypothetical protein
VSACVAPGLRRAGQRLQDQWADRFRLRAFCGTTSERAPILNRFWIGASQDRRLSAGMCGRCAAATGVDLGLTLGMSGLGDRAARREMVADRSTGGRGSRCTPRVAWADCRLLRLATRAPLGLRASTSERCRTLMARAPVKIRPELCCAHRAY